MESFTELLDEIFGNFAKLGVSSKVLKWLRYTIRTLGVIFAVVLIYFKISSGISCLNENDVAGGISRIVKGALIVWALAIIIFSVVNKNKK